VTLPCPDQGLRASLLRPFLEKRARQRAPIGFFTLATARKPIGFESGNASTTWRTSIRPFHTPARFPMRISSRRLALSNVWKWMLISNPALALAW